MATVVVINTDAPEPFVRLRGALTDKGPILDSIGAILEAGAQEAFAEQRFGDFAWPERYPNQSEPFINIAAALSDFNKGRDEPLPRRFDRRPALLDTSELMGSVRSRVLSSDTVDAGSTVPYAPQHQWGLVSSQPVTPQAKNRIAKWLLTPGGTPYRGKLTFLLQPNRTTLDTQINQRPFLGVTTQMEGDIQRTVEEKVAEAASGGDA